MHFVKDGKLPMRKMKDGPKERRVDSVGSSSMAGSSPPSSSLCPRGWRGAHSVCCDGRSYLRTNNSNRNSSGSRVQRHDQCKRRGNNGPPYGVYPSVAFVSSVGAAGRPGKIRWRWSRVRIPLTDTEMLGTRLFIMLCPILVTLGASAERAVTATISQAVHCWRPLMQPVAHGSRPVVSGFGSGARLPPLWTKPQSKCSEIRTSMCRLSVPS